MSNFWKTKEGKVFSHAIHERNSSLGYIVNAVGYIELLLKSKDVKITFDSEKNKENFYSSLESIRKGKEKCKESVDYAYIEIKNQTQ